MNKSLIWFAAALLSVACTKDGDTIYKPDPNEETASTVPLVTVIYDANALGDRSYNDLIYEGVERTAQELGLRTMQQSPRTHEEGLQYLELMFRQMETATDSVRRLFIVASPGYDDFIRSHNSRLEANPYADLLYLETSTPLEGKGSTLFMSYYGAMYEAGRIQAMTVYPKVMLVGANRRTEAVTNAMKGYQDGFETGLKLLTESQTRRAKLSLAWLDETGEGGFTIADSTAMKLLMQWSEEDYDAIVPVCGGSFNTFARLNSLVGLTLEGVDSFYDSYYSVYSIVKHISRAMDLCIRQWLSGEGIPKHQTLGLASGYTEVILNRPVEIWEPEGYEGETVPTLTEEMKQAIHEEAVKKEESLTPEER
jgi:basic membrane protein A